ncbi:MAG: Tim44/TimA family putative adaptor protein [Alphaproteobacteria bacterium]
MNNFPYIDILILAMVAIFIINRLKNTLGKKTGNENDLADKYSQGRSRYKESNPDKVVEKSFVPKDIEVSREILHDDPSTNKVLRKIKSVDKNFLLDSFLDGSKKAFEYIIKNYSEENIKPLKKLLSSKMYSMFDNQISKRSKKGQNLDINIIGVKDPEIVSADIKNNKMAEIKVKFMSEQVQIVKNSSGKIVEGDNNQILSITENWLFYKTLNSKDPNWILDKIEECN